MKIQPVTHSSPKRSFQVKASKRLLQLPYSKVGPQPSAADPIARVFVDSELGSEGFTYSVGVGQGRNGPLVASHDH